MILVVIGGVRPSVAGEPTAREALPAALGVAAIVPDDHESPPPLDQQVPGGVVVCLKGGTKQRHILWRVALGKRADVRSVALEQRSASVGWQSDRQASCSRCSVSCDRRVSVARRSTAYVLIFTMLSVGVMRECIPPR